MRRFVILISMLFILSDVVSQDIKGGYFSYQNIDNIRYEATCFLHVDPSLDLNRQFLILETGAYRDTLFFAYETLLTTSIKKKVYHGIFNYPPSGIYLMKIEEPYRIANINNFANSLAENFAIHGELILSPFFIQNNSVQIFNYPNNIAFNGSSFIFNPTAWDPDSDSLSFSIIPCFANSYSIPDSVYIDSLTGEISFIPDSNGVYSVCFMVEEWRKIQNNIVSMGSTTHEILFEINTLGINELINSNFELFPNPNNGNFNLTFNSNFSSANIKIYDGLGRLVHAENQKNILQGNTFPLQIPQKIPGLYLLSVETEKGVFTSRLLVNE